MRPSILKRVLPLFVLLLAAFLVYRPGLSGGFLFDDFPNIVQNPRVQAETLDWESIRRAAGGYQPGVYGRPLATVGFALDYAIGGKDATAFKVHSLVVHLLNTLLVFVLVGRLFARAGGEVSRPRWAPFAIALMWAIHPLQVSTVLYIVQRMEMLAVTFVLLASLAYLRGRGLQQDGGRHGWRWIGLSALLAGIGMLAKETAVLFPLFTFALELTVLRFEGAGTTRRRLITLYTVGAAVGALLYVGAVLPESLREGAYSNRDFTAGERVLTQLRVLPMYLGQMLLPLPDSLPFYYDDFPASKGLLAPATTLAGGLLLAALAAVAWFARRRVPLLALGIFWFFAAHAITSNVIRLEMVFEHRNYFALLGILLAIAEALRLFAARLELAKGAMFIGVLILGFGFLAVVRTATWGNPLLLATDLVARNPASARASSDVATLYAGMADGDPDSLYFPLAMMEFERGSRLPSASPLPEQGMILMAATAGLPVDPAWWDSLDAKLRSRPISPQEMIAVTGLVTQRMKGVELDDVRLAGAFDILLKRTPGNPMLHVLYAQYLLEHGDDDAAAGRHFAMAIALQADDPTYAARVLAGLVADGHIEAADALTAELARLQPSARDGNTPEHARDTPP